MIIEVREGFICSLQFFEVLEMCCFIFFDNERVVVIKQSIMEILPVEKQYEISLIIGIPLKHQMSSSEVTGFAKCL